MTEIKIVITGASGFVGTALQKNLCKFENLEVIPVCKNNSNIGIFDQSIINYSDFVIHLAEPNSEGKISQDFEKSMNDAKSNARKLIDSKFKNIIYVSSASVYGSATLKTFNENDNVTAHNKYAMLKLEIEKIFNSKANSVILRPSNIYGPGMSHESVITRILSQLNQDGPIKVRSVSSVRDFIYVDDVCQAIIKLVLRIAKKPLPNRIYNVGTGIGTSIYHLTELILSLSQQTERKIESELSEKSLDSLVLNVNQIRKDLNWSPVTSLRSGLSKLLNEK